MLRRFLGTSQDVADEVRARRAELGLTQRQVAERAGVGRRFVVDLEAGHPRAELDKTLAVLQVLGIHALALPSIPADDSQPIDIDEVLAKYATA